MFTLTALNTHFIWPFSVSIWFKQSKCALNIDSNGHQEKKNKKNKKTQKNVLKQKNPHKNMFFLHLVAYDSLT